MHFRPFRFYHYPVSFYLISFLSPSVHLINPSLLHPPHPLFTSTCSIHPLPNAFVRRPQLLRFRLFRLLRSPPSPHLISRRTFSLPLYPLQCSCKFAWMYPWRPKASPLGFGRPPPLPAMSRCPPGPRQSAPSADLAWRCTNAQRMNAVSAHAHAARYPHLNKPIALQKCDLLKCVPRPTRASWRCSPWVYPMARRLAGDTHVLRAHPWSGAEKTMHTRCFIHALCDL